MVFVVLYESKENQLGGLEHHGWVSPDLRARYQREYKRYAIVHNGKVLFKSK